MAVTLKDAEENGPRADCFAVLIGQKPRELVEMGKVVGGPSGQKLAQGHRAESGMAAAAIEVGGLKVHRVELVEALGADGGEFVEQLCEGFALRFFVLAFAVEGLKSLRFAVLEDHGGAGNPVGVLGMDEVADDVEGGPSVETFVGVGKRFGEVAEKGLERGGSAGEKCSGLGKRRSGRGL